MIPAWFTQRAFVLLWCISMFCNSLPHDRTPRNLKLSLPIRNPAQPAAHRCFDSSGCEQKASKMPFVQARYLSALTSLMSLSLPMIPFGEIGEVFIKRLRTEETKPRTIPQVCLISKLQNFIVYCMCTNTYVTCAPLSCVLCAFFV